MRYIILLIGVILLLLFGFSDTLLYSKTGFVRWMPFIVIVIGIPFLLYKSLKDFKLRQDYALGIAFGSVLIFGPLFGIWTDSLSDKDLEKNGQKRYAIVSEKWWSRKHKSHSIEWLYKAEFYVNNKRFTTFSAIDKSNTINLGDTVMIVYSKRNPENNHITED